MKECIEVDFVACTIHFAIIKTALLLVTVRKELKFEGSLMELSNRELSALIWTAAILVYIFFKDKGDNIAKSFKLLVRAFFSPQIMVVVLCAALWIILCLLGLHYVDIWTTANLKTTILWSFAFAFLTLMDVNRISEDNTYFKKTIRDTVNVTAIITFIAEAYSFPLFAELVLFPFLFCVTAMHVMSGKKKEHASVHSLMSGMLVTVGCAYIGYGIYMAATDFEDFATWSNLCEFFIPIILSLLFLPYLYLISILVSYELIWVSLRFALKDASLRRYAMLQATIRFRFDLEGLRRWKRNVGAYPPESREGILNAISEVKKYQKRERSPSNVSPDAGWCPIAATGFLLSENLKTSDYHRTYDDEWWASSTYLTINEESLFSSNIAYYISGDKQAVKRLKLVLNVNNNEDSEVAEARFHQVCEVLFLSSIGDASSEVLERISHGDDIDTEVHGRRVRLRKEAFVNTSRGGYSRTMTIDYSPDCRAPYE
ncbi:hypothetical protein M2404_001385 [Rheinheimera pacifica]|uniref:hypothetical protein n=1 Tax=Rheinheimera pacifica TaxID=173990 RepID=UPI002169E2B3|nr:hypothetical protein [Rheinheimera pacifica]MCS4307060.1 hypothetical protein [Rheinheimera pacifica]